MEANELRVGNLVYVLGKEREIIGISKHNGNNETTLHYAEFSGIIPVKLFHLKPIPLTEERLKNIGLRKMKNYDKKTDGKSSYSWFYDSVALLSIQREDSTAEWGYFFEYPGLCFQVSYVHELQNLYFGIFRNELAFEEDIIGL